MAKLHRLDKKNNLDKLVAQAHLPAFVFILILRIKIRSRIACARQENLNFNNYETLRRVIIEQGLV
jgi:hypothetical protein